jgi:2-oxo-4-hydroxy-4-carboxy-5-ureidoimidazoline decarboxylase
MTPRRSATTFTRDELLALCGSTHWAAIVEDCAPFADRDELHGAADEAFDQLDSDDWLQAFAHHPRIGDVESLRERFAASGALSEAEQAGLDGAGEDVVAELAAGNERYEAQFGFVVLIRAAGRSAAQMLEHQRRRLSNDRATELVEAAAQQREITHLRIDQTWNA